MNLLSLLVGLFALVCAMVAFLPLLGWLYWIILPVAVIGLVLGVLSRSTSGRNLNLVVLVVGTLRLMLGGGII